MINKVNVVFVLSLSILDISNCNLEEIDFFDIKEASLPHLNDNIFKLPSTPPQCAKGSTFCVKIDSYPFSEIFDSVANLNSNFIYFGVEEISPQNHGFGNDDKFLCESVRFLMFPQVALNTRNQWKYIVNLGRNTIYHQAVTIERCVRENRSCENVGVFTNGYTVTCKQKYAVRRLIAIEETGEPKSDTFMFPIGCCCAYKKINL